MARSSSGIRSERSRSPTRSETKCSWRISSSCCSQPSPDRADERPDARLEELDRAHARPVGEELAREALPVERLHVAQEAGHVLGRARARSSGRDGAAAEALLSSSLRDRLLGGAHHLAGAVAERQRLGDAAEPGDRGDRVDAVAGGLALRHREAVAALPGAQRLDRDPGGPRQRADREPGARPRSRSPSAGITPRAPRAILPQARQNLATTCRAPSAARRRRMTHVPGATLPGDGSGRSARCGYWGMRTVSITWMTPLDASTSALTTLAPFTFTPFDVSIFTIWPSTVFASLSFTTSAAMTLPATTW